jgi:hypothetical protein
MPAPFGESNLFIVPGIFNDFFLRTGGGTSKLSRAFLRPGTGLFLPAVDPETRENTVKTGLTGELPRHHSLHVRSKYFKKSEKKACQPLKTSLILTAKPNQTNGETNDKKRTAHVRIDPLSTRGCGRSSFPHRRQRERAGAESLARSGAECACAREH